MSTTPHLGLQLLATNQASKEVSVNVNSLLLDTLLGGVLSRDLATPPAIPADGDSYIIPAGASGVWDGHENDLAVFFQTAWFFYEPTALLGHPVRVLDENLFVLWTPGSPGEYRELYALHAPFVVAQRIAAAFGNGGAPLVAETSNTVFVPVSNAGTIRRITILGQGTGSASVNIFRDSYANYPPTPADTIFTGSPQVLPAIVAGSKYRDDTLTDVDVTVNAGDIFGFQLVSSSGFTQLSIYLEIE